MLASQNLRSVRSGPVQSIDRQPHFPSIILLLRRLLGRILPFFWFWSPPNNRVFGRHGQRNVTLCVLCREPAPATTPSHPEPARHQRPPTLPISENKRMLSTELYAQVSAIFATSALLYVVTRPTKEDAAAARRPADPVGRTEPSDGEPSITLHKERHHHAPHATAIRTFGWLVSNSKKNEDSSSPSNIGRNSFRSESSVTSAASSTSSPSGEEDEVDLLPSR